MSYLVLARKYRPQTFDEVINQTHVTHTLKNAILSGRVAHAILFTGPRGTGKTTVARILAKAMNCSQNKESATPNPCNECRSCKEITTGNAADVFEIDGASNNSVDQIRDLRENVKYMPSHSPCKIYIIDEVHMLSLAAFNALLKTLEEPPAHIMFMFATTEPHKIPITILSRCQRHDLRRISLDELANHMEVLCKKEEIDVPKESLELIAREAGGSMRDALSLLDQVISCADEEVTHDHMINVLGVVDRKIIFEISAAILNGDISTIICKFDDLYSCGHDIKKLYSSLMDHFRNLLVVKMGKLVNKLVDVPAHEIALMGEQVQNVSQTFLSQILDILFKEESAIRLSLQPKIALEMAFIKIFEAKPALSIDTLIEKIDELGKELHKLPDQKLNLVSNKSSVTSCEIQKVNPESQKSTDRTTSIIPEVSSTADSKPPQASISQNIETVWETLSDLIISKYPSLEAPFKNCSLKNLSEKSIEIMVNGDAFNINMITRKKEVIQGICDTYFGKKIDVIIDAKPEKKKEQDPIKNMTVETTNHPLVKDAIEVFNGKIVDIKSL